MLSQQYRDRVSDLQAELGNVKDRGDTKREIAILAEISELALSEGDLGLAHMHFDLASRVIRGSRISLDRLHEVLGGRALVMKHRKRYPQSLELYREAADAARDHASSTEVAHWVSRQGAIHRLMGQTEQARDAFERARALFADLGDAGWAGVADQEGNLGLLAADAGDDSTAAKAYQLAVELATSAGSEDLVATWATNLGNVRARQRRYAEAWQAFERAMDATLQTGDELKVRNTAVQWANGYRRAHQHAQAADTLLRTAGQVARPALRESLMENSLSDLYMVGAYEQLIQVGSELMTVLRQHGVGQDRLERLLRLIDLARKKLAQQDIDVTSLPAKPTILDGYIVSRMAECVERNDLEGIRDVAHLICDVNLGLLNPSEKAWQPLLSESYLRYRVVGEAMLVLCKEGKPEQSFEISQRFKSVGFSAPNLERLIETNAPNQEAADYLARLQDLSQAVAALQAPAATLDGLQRVEAVRAAGERLLEAGVKLHDRDPILQARLGGLVPIQGLIEALPTTDPAAVVDLVVTSEGTILHILRRISGTVRIIPGFSPHFTAEHAMHLTAVWAETNVAHEISERQKAGLAEISSVLHDHLFCALADQLSDLSVPQVILIPDPFTRHLPLHLAGVCGENLQHIIEHINIPDMSTDVETFSEVFPMEYAPCVQAVAVSQHQKRPRDVSAVLSLANPVSDLPGSQTTAAWLEAQLPDTLTFTSYIGENATLENLFTGLENANVVVIGTHGHFDSANPTQSHLVFSNGEWKMAEMLDQQLFRHSPVIVLSACAVGATAPTLDELAASGIPGALISAGAACVLASMWPVEDISMGYVVERFVTHLSHRGYRPAAALFRALRDLRLLAKPEALERCDSQIKQMKSDGSANRRPNEYFMLHNLVKRIKCSADPHPFASPQWWGGIIVVGSGWARPAGAMVGPLEDTLAVVEDELKRDKAKELMLAGRAGEAKVMLKEILVDAEGAERARTLDALAWAVWLDRGEGAEQSAKKEALALLDEAEFVAQAEQNEQLQRNINATRQKIELWEV